MSPMEVLQLDPRVSRLLYSGDVDEISLSLSFFITTPICEAWNPLGKCVELSRDLIAFSPCLCS